MNQQLLADFIRFEAIDYVRELLLNRIAQCGTGEAIGIRKYEFNRYDVTIDCNSREVTIEDDLNPEPDGRGSWSLEEFESALRR